MSDTIDKASRRQFLKGAAIAGGGMFTLQAAVAEMCGVTPAQTPGPYYPLSFKTDDSINDLTIIDGHRATPYFDDPNLRDKGTIAVPDQPRIHADLRKEVGSITAPTLIVCGSHDAVTTVADGHYLQNHIHGSELSDYYAAHLSSVELGEVFALRVTEFLLA